MPGNAQSFDIYITHQFTSERTEMGRDVLLLNLGNKYMFISMRLEGPRHLISNQSGIWSLMLINLNV